MQCDTVTDYDRFQQDLTRGEAKLGLEGLFTSGPGATSCVEGEAGQPSRGSSVCWLGGSLVCLQCMGSVNQTRARAYRLQFGVLKKLHVIFFYL